MAFDARIRRFAPVQALPAALQERAVSLASIRAYADGDIVYTQGASDETVHFLLAGKVEFLWQDRATRVLTAASEAAQDPLDPPGRKRYTVRAVHDVTIATFRRAALERLLAEHETRASDADLEVSEIAAEESTDWMTRLLQSELFSVLPATTIQEIFARMEEVPCRADDVVVRQGEAGEYYYVVQAGYCEVSRTIASGRGQIHLADLGPGTAFGEEALISGGMRNASVTMLSDGLLMRLGKQDFATLILDHVLHMVSLDAAIEQVDRGAAWLDIRYPEDHANHALRASENIPLNMLRLQSNRLSKDRRYVICGADVKQSSIAAFLLSERGFDVAYLESDLAAVRRQRPDLFVTAAQNEVASRTGAPEERGRPDEADPLDNTITRISRLSTHEQARREMEDVTPVEAYAHTATGHELATLLDELTDEHDQLASERDRVPPAETEDDAMSAEPRPAPADLPGDGVTSIMRELEQRLAADVQLALEAHGAQLDADYRERVMRMRESARQHLPQVESDLRRALEARLRGKERLLRVYYKKLIALANTIGRQKAQLEDAKRRFEGRLGYAERLYREVGEMRQLLSGHLVSLDREPIGTIPVLGDSADEPAPKDDD